MIPAQSESGRFVRRTLRDGRFVGLRLLTPQDGERLARFYAGVPREDFRFYCPHPLDREHALRNAAAADAPDNTVLVAVVEDEIVGYCWVRTKPGENDFGTFGICVARTFQGCGLGTLLIERLLEITESQGPPVIHLTVQEANPRAVALYTRFGFRITRRGIREASSGFPEEPQFWMERVQAPVCELREPVRVEVRAGEANAALGEKAFELLARTILERSGVTAGRRDAGGDIILELAPDLGAEAFRITGPARGPVRIEASDGRGLIYGVGRFLRASDFEPGSFRPGTWRGMTTPAASVRGMYFATHFHNWYHTAPLADVTRYVEELALYGCNSLSVWFDMHHYRDIDDPAAQAMIERLRAILEAANRVGIGASLTLLANEGFQNTPPALRASNAVENGYRRTIGGFYHTEICPSRAGGLELILANRRAVLEAFAGIQFDCVWIWPYDQGGCTCAKCAPWGANGFLRTAAPVAGLVRRQFPDARIVLSTWYFDRFIEGEWEQFHRWVDREHPSWFDFLMIDGFGAFPEYPLRHGVPGDSPVVGFPEISMEGNAPWGGYGANPRPAHWEAYWRQAKDLLSGSFPYSEGIFEDVNKFLMLQLHWEPTREVDHILREYAAGWFGRQTADAFPGLCRALEKDESTLFRPGDSGVPFTNVGGLPEAESCEISTAALDERLQSVVRRSWRWRLFRLRARIDAELKAGGMRFTPALDRAFTELADLYCADPEHTRGCVRPPSRP